MNWLLAAVSAVLLILAFPRFDLAWLAPVALAPLLLALAREPRWPKRFLLGWAGGAIYWGGVCYWIQFVLQVHGGMGPYGSWGAFALFAILKGLHMALFAVLAGPLLHCSFAIPAAAAIWTGLERTHGTFGFAWLTLGDAGIETEALARLAPYAGVYALSFALAMINAAVAILLLRRPRRELAWLLALPPVYLLPPLPPPSPAEESAAVVQANVEAERAWNAVTERRFHKRMASLSLQAALAPDQPGPAFLLWPELPAPLYYESDARLREIIADVTRAAAAPLLFGAVAFTPGDAPLNSAFLVDPAGKLVDRYDKIYLVPFGEFVPPVFSFVNRITQEAGDFVSGTRVVVFPVDGHRVGAFICYESVFPHLVRRFAASGAEVLVNLSNDGYFGRSAARGQHLKIVRMRALENRRWVLRATNDGITAAIDPAGRLVRQLAPHQETAARLEFSYRRDLTPYTRHGDWFAWSCLAAGAAAAAAAAIRGGSQARRRP